MIPNDGQKHSIQFYNSASVETDASELNYVVIAATDQMLDEIGGLILASGARFPSDETAGRTFRFNKAVAQELIWIGLQLMGAAQLDFDADWSDSPDSDFHASWELDSANKGHWILHLKNPEFTDGTDGREVQINNNGTYIQWRYVGDSSWTNLVALSDITGPQGEQGIPGIDGIDGIDGINGADGNTVLYGSGIPDNSLGVNGNFYINISTNYIYGPKSGGVWPAGTSLVGPSGSSGSDGRDGADGRDGTDGADGADGADGGSSPSDTPDLSPSDDTKCAVATECANMLHTLFVNITNVDSTTRGQVLAGEAGIGTLASLLFPPAAVAIGVMGAVVGLYNLLLTAEANGYIPLFDTDILIEIKCQLYCILDNTGRYDADVHSAWASKINETADGLHAAMYAVMNQVGYKPFQWAAISAPLLASPDCSDCDCPENWIYQWDFTASDCGFSCGAGSWVSGEGFMSSGSGTFRWTVDIDKAVASDQPITALEMDFYSSDAPQTGESMRGYFIAPTAHDLDSGSTGDYTLGASISPVTSVTLSFQNSNLPGDTGSIVNIIRRVRIKGNSVRPTTLTDGAFL